MSAAAAREPAPLRVTAPVLPAQFDPHKAASSVDLAVAGELFMGLVARDALGNMVPGAAHWEISPDGLIYTFRLREGLQWSDGAPLQAGDFIAGLTRALDPATAAPFAGDLLAISGAVEFHQGLQPAQLLGVAAPDAQTVTITLARRSARFLQNLSRPVAMPLPRHHVAKQGEAWALPQNLVGSGAFSIEVKDGAVELITNPRFIDARAIDAPRIIFSVSAGSEDAALAVREGDADISVGFGFEGFGSRFNPRGLKAQIGQNLFFVAVNVARPPFNRREARHALAMAIDREGLIKSLRLSDTVPAYAFVPAAAYGGISGNRAPYAPLPVEVRGAIAEVLLAESKIDAAHPVSLGLVYARGALQAAIAKGLAAGWAKLGVQLRLEEKSTADYDEALRSGAFDLALATWPVRDADPAGFLAPLASTAGPWNAGRYADPDFDQRLADADAETDPAQRPIAVAGAEVVLIQDQAVLPMFFYTPLRAVGAGVEGWQPNAYGVHPLRLLAR